MRTKRLKLKKEIIANLSGAESNQIKGGTSLACGTEAWSDCGCWNTTAGPICGITNGSCLCNTGDTQDFATRCCVGGTYADCTITGHCK